MLSPKCQEHARRGEWWRRRDTRGVWKKKAWFMSHHTHLQECGVSVYYWRWEWNLVSNLDNLHVHTDNHTQQYKWWTHTHAHTHTHTYTVCITQTTCYCGTTLIQTQLGQLQVSTSWRCPNFRACNCSIWDYQNMEVHSFQGLIQGRSITQTSGQTKLINIHQNGVLPRKILRFGAQKSGLWLLSTVC